MTQALHSIREIVPCSCKIHGFFLPSDDGLKSTVHLQKRSCHERSLLTIGPIYEDIHPTIILSISAEGRIFFVNHFPGLIYDDREFIANGFDAQNTAVIVGSILFEQLSQQICHSTLSGQEVKIAPAS